MPNRRLKAIKGNQIQSGNGGRKNISSEHAWKQKLIAFNRLLSPKKRLSPISKIVDIGDRPSKSSGIPLNICCLTDVKITH